jgi:topoisomerase-4 subunit A
MERFKLSALQADAILDLKLRYLRLKGAPSQQVRAELVKDGEEFGDRRRSPIVDRAAAKAFDASALIPAEPLTMVLSERGWGRAGKGHDLDPRRCRTSQADACLHAAHGRSNRPSQQSHRHRSALR